MQRNEITTGLTVRVRPTSKHNYGGYVIGRITTSTVGARSVGYYGKTATTVTVEWYATLNVDGTVRMWEETRTDGKFDARRLEVINLDSLAFELRSWHELRENDRRQVEVNAATTEANVDTIRAALGDDKWGYVRNEGRTIEVSDKQLAALVALVSKVVAS